MEKKISVHFIFLSTVLFLVILSCTISCAPIQQAYPTQSHLPTIVSSPLESTAIPQQAYPTQPYLSTIVTSPLEPTTIPQQAYPSQLYLTPASMEAILGEPISVVPRSDNWQTYEDTDLGLYIQYPPNWTAEKLIDTPGVGFYPPDSKPYLPTPAIKFRVMDQLYTAGQPLINTGSTVTPISIGGIMGQEYHDTKLSIPDQSIYIELPLGDSTLLIEATTGPTLDLTPQLLEMLTEIPFQSNETSYPISTSSRCPDIENCVSVNDMFWINRTEITVEMYQVCINAGFCSDFNENDKATHGSYFDIYPHYPVVNVTYWDAQRYCSWAGGQLPNSSEWSQAAGPGPYPWGHGIDCTLANYKGCIGFPTEVGIHRGVSPYGVYDMAGNVAEWVSDSCPQGHLLLGGSYNEDTSEVTTSASACRTDDSISSKIGFRCIFH